MDDKAIRNVREWLAGRIRALDRKTNRAFTPLTNAYNKGLRDGYINAHDRLIDAIEEQGAANG